MTGQEYVSDNNATCEQDGTKTAKCVRYGTGGCTATDTVTDTDSKLGHLFEDYASDNNATCEQDGTKTAKCVRYGDRRLYGNRHGNGHRQQAGASF